MSRTTVWRLVKRAYASEAYSGAGAQRFGGRFNSVGRRVVYGADSLSLAILEILVQVVSRAQLSGHLCVPATLPESMIAELPDLPSRWDSRPYTRDSQQHGDRWLDSAVSLAVRVPSVVVPLESNILINPLHRDAGLLEVGAPVPFPLDPRLLTGDK